MDECGLHKATRFDLARVLALPYTEEFFGILRGYQSPVIGRLSDHAIRLLQFQISFYQAALAT